MKIDKTVTRETLHIIYGSLIMSAVEQSVFLIIGKWDLTVLFGNLLTATVFVLDFFFLGITLQRVVNKKSKNEIKNSMIISRLLRFAMIGAAIACGLLFPKAFNIWAMIPPVFFNRITLFIIARRMPKDPVERSVVNDDDDGKEAGDEPENETQNN